jgi:hypothetical protein
LALANADSLVTPGSTCSWFLHLRNSSLAYCTIQPAAASIRDHACPPTFLHSFSAVFAWKYRTLQRFWYCHRLLSVHRPVCSQHLKRLCIRVVALCPEFFFLTRSMNVVDALTSVKTKLQFSAWPGSTPDKSPCEVRAPKSKSIPIVE